MKEKSKNILAGVADDFRFIKGWAKQPRAVGAIKPTSKQAAKVMVSYIPADSMLPILEFGPGTGIITRTMIESGIAPERIVSVEYDAGFVNHLRKTIHGVNFIEGDAFNLEKTLSQFNGQKFAAVLSGIPLLNFAKSEREKLITGGLKRIGSGPFIQLTYGPNPPVLEKSGIFTTRPSRWILGNIPPARFWIYEADGHRMHEA